VNVYLPDEELPEPPQPPPAKDAKPIK